MTEAPSLTDNSIAISSVMVIHLINYAAYYFTATYDSEL